MRRGRPGDRGEFNVAPVRRGGDGRFDGGDVDIAAVGSDADCRCRGYREHQVGARAIQRGNVDGDRCAFAGDGRT